MTSAINEIKIFIKILLSKARVLMNVARVRKVCICSDPHREEGLIPIR